MQDNNLPNKLFGSETDVTGLQNEYQDEDIILIENARWVYGRQTIRARFNFFVLCYEGSLSLTVNDIPLELSHSTLLRCPAGAVVSVSVASDDFKYMALAITTSALQSYLRANINIWNLVIYKNKIYTMVINESDFAILRKFHELLHCCLDKSKKNDDFTFRKSIIKGLVETELNAFCYKINVDESEKEPTPHSLDIFNQFLNSLQQREVKRLTVEQLASELCISSKYLSDICKKYSGKTAKQWIKEYTMADITYYLRSTNLSIKEISNLMGFPNCSFFCKYVKEHLHCSPTKYRQEKSCSSCPPIGQEP